MLSPVHRAKRYANETMTDVDLLTEIDMTEFRAQAYPGSKDESAAHISPALLADDVEGGTYDDAFIRRC